MHARQSLTTRRAFIRRAATLGLGLPALGILAACAPAAPSAPSKPAEAPKPTEAAKPAADTKPAETKPAAPAAAPATAPTSAPAAAVPASKPAEAAKPAQQDGDLTIAADTFSTEQLEPRMMNAQGAYNYAFALYDSMAWVDTSNKMIPGVAEKWELSSDGLTWTFSLRPGQKFHDGTDLTADDVVYSFQQLMAQDALATSRALFSAQIAEVSAKDPRTVVFKTKQPWGELPVSTTPLGGSEGMIMPKAYREKVGNDGFRDAPIGSGPYKFVSRTAGDRMTFEALPNHPFRPVSPFKRLILRLMPEEATKVASLKTGELDVANVTFDSVPELEAAGVKIMSIPKTTLATVGFWATWDPRAKDKPTSDVRVRKALSMAVNSDELIKALWGGRASPAAGAVPYMGPEFGPFNRPQIPYDQAQAKQLLSEAGYANGFDIKIYAFPLPGAPWIGKFAEALAGYWGRVGVRTQVLPLDFGSMGKLYTTKDMADEILGHAYTGAWTMQKASLNKSLHTRADGFRFVMDPKMVEALDRAMQAPDEAGQAKAIREASEIIYDSYNTPAFAYVDSVAALGKRVKEMGAAPGNKVLAMWFNTVTKA